MIEIILGFILGIKLHKCDFDMANMSFDSTGTELVYTCRCGKTEPAIKTAQKILDNL